MVLSPQRHFGLHPTHLQLHCVTTSLGKQDLNHLASIKGGSLWIIPSIVTAYLSSNELQASGNVEPIILILCFLIGQVLDYTCNQIWVRLNYISLKKTNNEQREESVFDGKDVSQGILLGDEFSSSSIQDFPEEVFVPSLDSPLCEKKSVASLRQGALDQIVYLQLPLSFLLWFQKTPLNSKWDLLMSCGNL